MPIPWFVVLQSVPWTDVIRNAPKVAEGAKKLWSSIGKKPPSPETEAAGGDTDHSSEHQSIAALQKRLAAVEARAANLHEQMLASSELIKALADQNAQLVRHIETNRVRALWLLVASVLSVALASSGLFLVLAR